MNLEKKYYDIFGHCNNALSIIIDLLQSSIKDFDVRIILCCNEDFLGQSTGIPFSINKETTSLSIQDYILSKNLKFIASMDNKIRKYIFDIINKKFNVRKEDYINLIHPSAYISNSTKIGYGNLVSPLSALAPFSKIGNFNHINRCSNIGHHTIIGSFCSINPGCNIAGNCIIRDNVTIGVGATILDNIFIAKNSIIGAGSVVTKNTKEDSVYYGVPAKFIKKIRES